MTHSHQLPSPPLYAVSASHHCKLKSGDVETAFLATTMDCRAKVKTPPYWGSDGSQPRRLLVKGIPGIPQGSRLFFETFFSHLNEIGFRSSGADKCLFLDQAAKEKLAVLLWVDDFIVMYESEELFDKIMVHLRKRFIIPSNSVSWHEY